MIDRRGFLERLAAAVGAGAIIPHLTVKHQAEQQLAGRFFGMSNLPVSELRAGTELLLGQAVHVRGGEVFPTGFPVAQQHYALGWSRDQRIDGFMRDRYQQGEAIDPCDLVTEGNITSSIEHPFPVIHARRTWANRL